MKQFYVYNNDKKVTLSKNDGQTIQLVKGNIFAVEYGTINDVYKIKPELLNKLLGFCSEFDTSKVIGTFAKSANGITGKVESVNNDGTVNLYIGNRGIAFLQEYVPSTERDYIISIVFQHKRILGEANYYRKEAAEFSKKFKGRLGTFDKDKHQQLLDAYRGAKKEADYLDSLLPKREYKERNLKLNVQILKFNYDRSSNNYGFDPDANQSTNVYPATNINQKILDALGWKQVFMIPGVPPRIYAESKEKSTNVEFLCSLEDANPVDIINKKLSELQ